MSNSHGRVRRLDALSGLDPRNLELQEELGDFDAEVSTDRSDAGLGGEVGVELVLEALQVVVLEGRDGGELVDGEGEGRLVRLLKVDGGEGDAVGDDVWDAGDGCSGRVACDGVGEGCGQVGDFGGELLCADDEAGVLSLFGNRCWRV